MTRVTNVSDGPRGIWSAGHKDGDGNVKAGELVMIDRGKSADVDLLPGEDPGEWFEFGGAEAGLADHTVAELREIAATEEIDLGDATKKADIIAAIELAREDKPSA